MKSFVIKELEKGLEILSYNYQAKGFVYKIKNNLKGIKISQIEIMNPEIVSGLVRYNFEKKYRNILEYYLSVLQAEDEDSDGKLMIALNEIARLRGLIIRKYNFYLDKELEKKFLKRLKILENEVRMKIIEFRVINQNSLNNNNIEEKCKSR